MKRISQLLVVLAALLFPLGMHATDFDLSGYSLVKSMDFSGFEAETALTQGETATEKAWDNGNGQNQTMYHVADEAYAGYLIVQAFANKGFIIGANSGLYSKSAQRCAAVVGRTKGQVVVFTTTQDADNVMSFYKTHAKGNNLPDGNYNLTKATDGKGYYVVMTDDGYLGFNGLNNKQAIAKIDIYQPNEGTNLANYAVKYVDESGAELQEAKTYTSAIGMQCNVYPADRPATITVGETTYVLSSNDAAEQTVAADGSTVVTLTYKVAVPVPYSVVEKAGDNIFRTTTGEAVTGSVIKLPYRFYNAANGQLYKKAQTSKEFNYSFTLTEENQVENLEYSAVEGINNVVFITEGEDVPGLTACNSSNTGIRSSNSASAYASEDTKIVTLGPGTYKIHAIIYDASKNPDSHWIFKAGEQQIADLNCTVVNIQELDSEEFTLTETTDIIMAAAGGNTMGLDALYIVGDGKAYDNLPAVLTFPDYNDQEISAYDKEWTATVDSAVWTLNGFNNNKNAWNYVRCGRKAKAQTATILSPALYANVTNVVYTVDKTSNVTKATVTVLNGEETVNTIDITEKFAAGNVNVEVEGQPGYSYLLTIDSDDQATGNGPTQISKVALYAEGQYVEVHIANTEDDPYTVEKAIELIEAGEALNEIVFVKGIITQVDEVNAEYGNATYWIADSEGAEQQLQVYRGLNIGGEKFTSEEQLEVGATVVVKGQLLKYGSKYELNQGNELVSYKPIVDVTSEYLKNADFAASTATDAEKIFGYGKDGQPYGLQDVEEWTKVVVAGDNGNADYPDSGLGGAVIAYGSPTLLQGGGKAAPEAGPDGEAGNSLGFFAVWSCSGYYAQDVKLPAGKYTLTVPVFNQGGTQVNGSFIGFFPEGQETGYTVDANVAPGEWTSQSVSFVLTKETAGQVRLGYAAANTGSANSPMLFIDGVDLKFAEVDAATIAKADLQAEIAAAEALLATGTEGKAELEAAIAKAKEALASATSADELNAALAALKDAELAFKEANKPVPNGTYYVMCASEEGDWFMAAGHNWGTRAIINNDGLDLTLNFDAPTGTYTIDTQVFNGNAKHFLGSDLYMDGAAFGWTIASDNGFTFTISNGTQYIGIDSEYNLAMTDQPAEWAFLKADARIMALDEASAENPVDATFLVKGANFNRNDKRNDAWTRTSETADGGTNFNISGGNNLNNCAESYHAKFSLSQTVEGLPNGIYEMTAQGFYRQDGEDAENLPYFFINDEKVTFPLKTGEENSMANASESFTNGLYTIEPIKIVVEDGKITLGAKNDENLNLWCIWDNFRLTYYGEEVKPVITSKPVPAFSEMADDGETIQYLYNVEAGGFLLGANDWNTRASVSESKGYQFKVAKAAEGTWTLNDYVENQNAWKAVFADNMSSIWVDNLAGANVNGWVIAEAGNGTYTITNPGADAEGKLAVHPLLNDSRLYLTNHLAGSTWAFVSEADYAKYLEDYAAWQASLPELLKSTEDGTDLTPAIGNICTSMDGWTITNESTFHINTWSWEGLSDGSWMTPSFLENWVAKGNLLPEGTVAKTISGLVPGQAYTVKAFMRAYNEGSQDVPQGAYLYAGDQQSADISTGTVTNYNGMAGVYGNFQVTAAADEEGNLTLGWVEKENNFNWIVMRDLQLFVGQVGDPNLLEQTITHERYPGLGYGATECTVDFTEAKAWLGVEQITTDMLRIENPDGELISDYAPFDGWFDGEGVATTWGDNTKINVKFFQAIPDGAFTICDMNGADEVGKTYTVKWRLVNGEKSVRYTINVKFVEKPVLDLTFADLIQKGNDVVVPFISELGKCYEGFSGDVDVAAILSTLEAASLSDVDIYAVQSDGSLDDNYKLGTTDGWRNAAGDWQGWGADARFYVKADFAREAGQLYEVGGMDGTTNEPASYTATYAFVKKGTKDAVVLKVTLTYPDPDELIANGNCEGADGGCLLSKNGDGDGSFIWNVQDGVGVDGSKAAVVHATGTAANEWDAQFFIFAKDHVFTVGEKYKVTMWLKADKAASNTAQAHTTPGNYKHWRIISDGSSIPFTTEWTELVYEGVIDENMEGVQTIAFNLNTDKTLENNYYFDNISWKLIKEEDGIETVQTVQTEVNGIYNLRGQKVDKPVKGGIYIINGKKVVIK